MQREEFRPILAFRHPKKQPNEPSKPNLPKWMFWDVLYEEMEWRESYLYVIGRVLERGNDEEYAEMIRFYGRDRVLDALRSEINRLPRYIIPRVCAYFGLQRRQLRCRRSPARRTRNKE